MVPISFKLHHFPADVIRQAVWPYFRFSLSFRDVEELTAARHSLLDDQVRIFDREVTDEEAVAADAAWALGRDGVHDRRHALASVGGHRSRVEAAQTASWQPAG